KKDTQDGFVDDLPYAKKVAKFLDVDLNVVSVGPDIINSLEKMIYHLDEPQGDPASLNVLLISQLAKEQGMKVLLSGAGGDDIFTGYRRHYAITQERYWKWLPKAMRLGLQSLSRQLSQQYVFTRRLSKAFKYAGLDGNERLASYFYWLEPEWLKKILSHEILEKLSSFNPAQPLLSTLGNLNDETSILDKMLYLEGKHFLADHNLNYTDKMGMAAGVEIRVPLLDLDLVEFAANLPDHYKQRGHEGKWIFKKAMEGVLPNDVIYRPKTGFGAPLRYWLKNELKELVGDMLSTANLKKRGLFNPMGVQELISQDRQGIVDAAYPIFAILCVEMWCQIFMDRVGLGSMHKVGALF
ncbi:MAG TPA: asparagine synthetase B, partial [Coxiellaceae bacterium]|nr:asparagine synthetase B [Coxiellaceae bacterium]